MADSEYGPYLFVPNSSGGHSRVCPEMVAAVDRAYELAELPDKLVWTQGGLNSGAVAASASVHDGLCVADLRSTNMTDAELWAVTTWLLRCGVVAFIRGVQDSLVDHLHCVMANPVHGHFTAKAQVAEYRAGGDGLVGSRPFYGPDVPFTTWEDSPYYPTEDDFMAEPKDVWAVDVDPADGKQSAGKVLWAILGYVKAMPERLAELINWDVIPSPVEWRKSYPEDTTWTGTRYRQWTFDTVRRMEGTLNALVPIVAAIAVETSNDAEVEAEVRALLLKLVEQGELEPPPEPDPPFKYGPKEPSA